jgi:hypothetical protein
MSRKPRSPLKKRHQQKRKPIKPRQAKALAQPVIPGTTDPIPPIPPRILLGQEPYADRYSGNWQPVESQTQPATEEELAHATAEMDAAVIGSAKTVEAEVKIEPLIIWKGTQRELAEHFVELQKTGEIEARGEQDVFRQVAKHFVVKDRHGDLKPISPDSLRVNLHQKRDKDRGNT